MHLAAMAQQDTPRPAQAHPAEVSRRSRFSAVMFDAAVGVGFTLGGGAAAVLLLLVTTRAGEVDSGRMEATVAWAIFLAGPAAWSGLMAARASEGATPGQQRAALHVAGAAGRRMARLAVHPLGAAAWAWLAVVSGLATIPVLPLLSWAAAILVAVAGVVSAVMILRDPGAATIHDRIAGTRMVAR